jgi:hypothetical protein
VQDCLPDTTECSFAVAFKGASWTDPDSIPLMVMQTMLGGWDKNSSVGKHASSQLTQTVASEGLADAFMVGMPATRFFCVCVALPLTLTTCPCPRGVPADRIPMSRAPEGRKTDGF